MVLNADGRCTDKAEDGPLVTRWEENGICLLLPISEHQWHPPQPAARRKKVTWPNEESKEVLVKLGLAGPLPRTW